MSLKAPSILHSLDSMVVFAGGPFASSALCITIVEVATILEVDLDGHWRLLSRLYETALASQSCFIAITGSIFRGMFPYTLICMISTNQTIISNDKSIESGKQKECNTDKKT